MFAKLVFIVIILCYDVSKRKSNTRKFQIICFLDQSAILFRNSIVSKWTSSRQRTFWLFETNSQKSSSWWRPNSTITRTDNKSCWFGWFLCTSFPILSRSSYRSRPQFISGNSVYNWKKQNILRVLQQWHVHYSWVLSFFKSSPSRELPDKNGNIDCEPLLSLLLWMVVSQVRS